MAVALDPISGVWLAQCSAVDKQDAEAQVCAIWKEQGLVRVNILFLGPGRFGENTLAEGTQSVLDVGDVRLREQVAGN